MRLHPTFPILGVLAGSFLVAMLGYFAMAGITLPEPALAAEPLVTMVAADPADSEGAVENGEQNRAVIEGSEDDSDGEFTIDEVEIDGVMRSGDAGSAQEGDAEEPCEVSNRFPDRIQKWCGLITHYAKKRNLDPDLVAALILQESGGDELAYSRSGAVGLMQIMPRDGLASSFQCVNGPCFSSRPSTDELHDPEFNISYGTKMLAGLIRKSGDTRDALKSYGPMSVGYSYADTVLALFKRYGRE